FADRQRRAHALGDEATQRLTSRRVRRAAELIEEELIDGTAEAFRRVQEQQRDRVARLAALQALGEGTLPGGVRRSAEHVLVETADETGVAHMRIPVLRGRDEAALHVAFAGTGLELADPEIPSARFGGPLEVSRGEPSHRHAGIFGGASEAAHDVEPRETVLQLADPERQTTAVGTTPEIGAEEAGHVELIRGARHGLRHGRGTA